MPIHAYPVAGDVQLPANVDIGAVPLADTKIKKFQLSCSVPIDFDFSVTVATSHPCFTVAPLHGTLPAKGTADITVTLTPQSYTTATFAFEVLLAQFNAKPMRCTVVGTSTPGLHKAATVAALTAAPVAPEQPRTTARPARAAPRKAPAEPAPELPLVVDGVVIPASLGSIHHVNKVLNQPSLDGLNARVVLNDKPAGSHLSRNAKQDMLTQELRVLAKRAARGDPELSHDGRQAILSDRRAAEHVYQTAQGAGSTVEALAFARTENFTEEYPARTFRRVDAPPALVPEHLSFLADPAAEWQRRAESSQRFISAARTVGASPRCTVHSRSTADHRAHPRVPATAAAGRCIQEESAGSAAVGSADRCH